MPEQSYLYGMRAQLSCILLDHLPGDDRTRTISGWHKTRHVALVHVSFLVLRIKGGKI